MLTAITKLAHLDNINCHDFHTHLATLQKAMGVRDGGFAGIFFDNQEEVWSQHSPEQRTEVIINYIREQLDWEVCI